MCVYIYIYIYIYIVVSPKEDGLRKRCALYSTTRSRFMCLVDVPRMLKCFLVF